MSIEEQIIDLTNKVIDNIDKTKDGNALLFHVNDEAPNFQITPQQMHPEIESPAGFMYPNTIEISRQAIEQALQTNTTEKHNQRTEAKYAIAIIHELLHRKQTATADISTFFEGHLPPREAWHAEMLIEAENYARTSQIAWRIAHDQDKPYEYVRDFMLEADSSNSVQSSHAVYAKHMQGLPITAENELTAMRATARDFLVRSGLATRYLEGRIQQMYAYLLSSKLSDKFQSMALQDFRSWMKSQPQIVGLGPDAKTCNPADIIKLGNTETGNLFEIADNFAISIQNPNSFFAFISDEYKQKAMEIILHAGKIKAMFQPQPNAEQEQHLKL